MMRIGREVNELFFCSLEGRVPGHELSFGGNGSVGTGSNETSFTTDDVSPDNSGGVVMGHSVPYLNTTGTTGSGTGSTDGTLESCVPALRK